MRRWLAPDGSVVQEPRLSCRASPTVRVSRLEAGRPGSWKVEARLDDDVIDSQMFTLSAD
jgi:hypothetical protein